MPLLLTVFPLVVIVEERRPRPINRDQFLRSGPEAFYGWTPVAPR